jgi:hypothetical protein
MKNLNVLQILYSGLGGHGNVAFSLIEGDESCKWSNQLCFFGIEELLPAYDKICTEKEIPQVYGECKPNCVSAMI